MATRAAAVFDINPGEEKQVFWMFGHSFMLGVANNFLQTVAFSLFLVRFNSQTLAWVYILNALIVPLLTIAYMRLGGRLPFSKVLAATLGFLLVLTAGAWLGLRLGAGDWLIFCLPILFQVVVNLGILEFWGLAARLYDVRQGKRLFGFVGAGQWLAIVLTGLLIPVLVGWMGTANLLIFSVIGLAGAVASLGVITRHNAARLSGETAGGGKQAEAKKESTASLFRSRYAVLIFGLVTLWWLAFFFLDNIFYDRAAAQYPESQELASFLGIFLAALGVITLISNMLVSGRVISRYGIRTSLMILPALMVIGTGGMSAAGLIGAAALLFWLTMGTKLANMAVGFSIDRAALTVLYTPIEAERRNRVQATAEGIFQPLANGLAGVGLLALGALFQGNRLPLIYALALISAAWLLVAAFIGREYPKVLTRAITRRRLGAGDLVDLDRSSLEMLEGRLRAESPQEVIYAMQMLEQAAPERLGEALGSLVSHPSELVRLEALERIERLERTELVEEVRRSVKVEKAVEVRAMAVRALAQLDEGDQSFELVSGLLEDPEALVQRAAMVGLLRSGGIAGVLRAGERLLRLAESQDPAERAAAAQALGEAGARVFYQPLIALLQDEEFEVQKAALRAAGKIRNPRLWPYALDKLSIREVRGEAARALASGGEQTLRGIQEAYRQAGNDRERRRLMVQIGGWIGGEEASRWLCDQVEDPDGAIRSQALEALNAIQFQAGARERGRFTAQIQAEARRAAEVLGIVRDLGEGEEVRLTREALVELLGQGRERVFLLLAMVYDRAAVLGARDNLKLAALERRAYAIEALDVLRLGELKGAVFPILVENPDQKASREKLTGSLLAIYPQKPMSKEQRLSEAIVDLKGLLNPWAQACAIFTAAGMEARATLPAIEQALQASDPLARETAIWALHQIMGNEARRLTAGLRLDPDPNAARTAERMQSDHPEGIVLTIFEKMLALKKASIFGETPDEALLQVAPLLEERLAGPGETVIAKGDLGDCMYILVDGEVRIHDGERTLNVLGAGAVFGEIAVLDAEPRTASVTALGEALLLRLSQETLYEAMDAYPRVARGIIRGLTHNLRARVRDVGELKERMEAGSDRAG